MSAKLEQCTMPNCYNYTDQGKRLCQKHAAAGKDLRIPLYVLNLGLENIYEVLAQQKQGFSVETILDILDPGYADRIDGANCKNGLAKLFRALRANDYLVKRGHVNGFVVYELGQGWHQSQVIIEDEPPQKSQSSNQQISAIEARLEYFIKEYQVSMLELEQRINDILAKPLDNKNLDKSIASLQQEFLGIKQQMTRLQNKDSHENEISILKQEVVELKQQIAELQQKNHDCPVARLREQMHVLFGGKRSATKL